ncbi:MAG: hypothetical protein VX328_03880 [Candidatus Thermoplasmatota archaeon]|nr:hypothetical protein [Candidatus Thermoplasmatota archaeon]
MVEILCPHCEGEIELDDDASGEFECPLCDGEFEWNMDDDDSYEDNTYPDGVIITTDFKQMPAVPKVTGILFSIYMGFVIVFGLIGIIGGIFLGSLESEVGTGTGFGALILIYSLVILSVGIAGLVFGIRAAKGDFTSHIVITVLSGIATLNGIFTFSGAADILSLLISISFTAWNVCCIFVPILKAQFTGVLVTQPKMSNDFDKTKSIHPVEWISHAVSLVVLIVIIIFLSSGSLYTVTVDGEIDIVMDLSGPEFPIFAGFGDETYSDISDDFELLYNDICLDGSNKECDEIKSDIDYWNSWNMSTLILKIMLIVSLIVCIIGILSRLVAILANNGMINLPDKGYMANDKVRKFSPLVTCCLLFIAIVLFMIMQPGNTGDYWQTWFDGDVEVETSFGFVVWIGLIFAMLTPVLSKFEIDIT